MEEIVALLIQFVLEVGLQLFGSIDAATGHWRSEKEEAGCGWLIAFAAFGAICGGLSLIFAPKLLLPNVGLRIANLILAPLVAGGLSFLVPRRSERLDGEGLEAIAPLLAGILFRSSLRPRPLRVRIQLKSPRGRWRGSATIHASPETSPCLSSSSFSTSTVHSSIRF